MVLTGPFFRMPTHSVASLQVNRCTEGADPKQEFDFTKWKWSGDGDSAVDA